MPLREAGYTCAIASAMDRYLETKFNHHTDGALVTDNTEQAPYKLEKGRAFDLIKRISGSNLIILEVKIRRDDTLPAFDQSQHDFYSAIYNYGIPIQYCYNLKTDYIAQNDAEYTLRHSKVSPPDQLFETEKTLAQEHRTLLEYIEWHLVSEGGDSEQMASILSAVVLADTSEITNRILLIAYNPALRQLDIYYPDEVREIVSELGRQISIPNLDKEKMSEKQYVLEALNEISGQIESLVKRALHPRLWNLENSRDLDRGGFKR